MACVAGPAWTLHRASCRRWKTSWTCAWTARACSWVRTSAFDNGQGRVGVMGTLAKSDATSRSQLTGYSARGKLNGGALGVYGNWSNDALYVDASVQRGHFRNRVQGEGLAEERYDSDIWQSSLEAGYRFGIGQIGSTALSLQPELQLVTPTPTPIATRKPTARWCGLGDSGLSGRVGLRLQGEGRSAARRSARMWWPTGTAMAPATAWRSMMKR